jgi:Transketolase, pyrimidine binding domain
MHTITYARAIKEAMTEEMRRDPAVILYGEDVANFGGISKSLPDSRKNSVRSEFLTRPSRKMRSWVQESVPQ